jgi:predicted metalloprotease
MRWEDLEQSSNIEDRRGESGYVGGGGGGGFGGLPIGGGGLGLGGMAVIALIGWGVFGINPIQMIALLSGGGGGYPQTHPQPRPPGLQTRQTGTPSGQIGNFVSRILGSTEVQWKDIFAKSGKTYTPPILVMYAGSTDAACGGVARSAMGPFYCPQDHKVYLDTSFFSQIQTRFNGCSGSACQFSQAYVIAHEVGHHVQTLLGVLPNVQRRQAAASKVDANALQVRVELQADCLAGVWANHENERQQREGKQPFFDQNDVEAALQTASAIGDDTLERKATGRVVPDSFTHGSGAQRQRWFTSGLQKGTLDACDTFGAGSL